MLIKNVAPTYHYIYFLHLSFLQAKNKIYNSQSLFETDFDIIKYINPTNRSTRMSRKNHKTVDGRLLQTDKKFSALKQSQKTWIYEIAQIEYERYISKYKKQPRKAGKDIVVERVSDKLVQKGIWIPHYELANAIGKYVDRQNRRTSFEAT